VGALFCLIKEEHKVATKRFVLGNGSDPGVAKTSISLPLSAIQRHGISADIKLTIGIMYTNLTAVKDILRPI
jgi:hypothetical protein